MAEVPRKDGLEYPTQRFVESRVEEAPLDGYVYARKNGQWVTSGSEGTDEVVISSSPPHEPYPELWLDTSDTSGGGSVGVEEVYVGDTPPPTPTEIWVDTSIDASSDTGPNEVHIGPSPPSTPTELWLDTDDPAGTDAPQDSKLYGRFNAGWWQTAPVLVLGASDPVPGGTKAGTVIVRLAT